MKLTTAQKAGLTLGLGLAAGAFLSGALVPHLPAKDGLPTVAFERNGPCSTCGAAAPVRIDVSDGQVWHITGPGTTTELGKTYCWPLACRISKETR